MENIKEILERASSEYYKGSPIMTDAEYDALADKYYSESPDDYHVGAPPELGKERELPIPMFSLNKEKDMSRILSWVSSNNIGELVITPKLDGISLCVDEFNSPERRFASTRGNGVYGQICDTHYSMMNSGDRDDDIPVITFGEAIMSKKKFEKYDKDNGGMYKNARNLVGSQVNSDNMSRHILADIDYIRYGMSSLDGSVKFQNRSDELDFLNTINKAMMPYRVVSSDMITHAMMMSLYDEWSDKYNIDGLVIEVNSKDKAMRMGRDSNMNPSYAKAYKGHFDESSITSVNRVIWQVSRHGKLKPVVEIDTVRLSGVDVSRVTAYNARNVIDLGIGVDAVISVVRSGAVIPKIVEVHNRSTPDIPHECPSCGGDLENNGVDIVCYNDRCPEAVISRILFFFSTLGCKDVGRGVVEAIYNGLNIDTVKGFLTVDVDSLASMDRYGYKKANKICSSIKACVNGVAEAKLMHASSCFIGVGEDSIRSILDGSNTGVSDTHGYNEGLPRYNEFYSGIKDFVKITGVNTNVSNKLAHLNVVFTGFRDANIESTIRNNGGKVSASVSNSITHLVVAYSGSGTTKENKAIDLGKVIMDRDEFLEYLNSIL